MNWQRLLDLLILFRDGDPVDPTWRTVIMVMTSDDLRPSFPAYAQLIRPDDDGDSKESEPSLPDHVDLPGGVSSRSTGKSLSKKRSSFGDSSSGSKHSKKFQKAPLHIQDRISDSKLDCRSDDDQVLWTEASARQSLSDHPVAWEDLRMDLQVMMISGVKYPGAREWLEEDRIAHTHFELEPLMAMLSRVMFWNKLDDVF
ncbi:hypothetical protein P3T76_012189 [Phytophthora citrophthora]|uniref:Uncharacterized protein n=1 Tax=Phytophthora citrophthora TaxID=4793 RepID=A0AAD9G692_9STRA|nr:hypothetical protein P3T76_012189 [Phytophthora citrophthora]